MSKTSYSEKLKDPRWQKKRLEIMQRDNFTCTLCGDKESFLNVHHMAYSGMPWEIPNESLITTCEFCHKNVCHNDSFNFKDAVKIERTKIEWGNVLIISFKDKDVLLTVSNDDRQELIIFPKNSIVLKNLFNYNQQNKSGRK
jgi:hypothetical protein